MTTNHDHATVHILRFDQHVGGEPRWQTFENVPYEGRRVLDVLNYLMEYADSTLGFRQSCRAGLCAACDVRVNGKTVLACKRLAEPEMRIEPAKPTMVVRDTVLRADRLAVAKTKG